jgi:DNA-binding NarL/FixJ family response regulator
MRSALDVSETLLKRRFTMSLLGEKYKELGIQRILIADDTPANLEAARAVASAIPEISFAFAASAAEALKTLQEKPDDIGLVLTDLQMETPNAGVEVFERAMGFGIPAAVVTSFDHHGPWVRVASPAMNQEALAGEKNNPEVWSALLASFAATACSTTAGPCVVLRALGAVREIIEGCHYDRAMAAQMGQNMRCLLPSDLRR